MTGHPVAVFLYHGSCDGPTTVATTLMTLHVAAHTEGLPTTSVGAAEGLLARVAVRVDAQAGRSREGLVAGAADIAIMVLLVGCGAGGREVVVVLPGRVHRGDNLLRCCRCRERSGRSGRRRALVEHGGGGRRLNGRGVGRDAGSGRSVGSAGDTLNGTLAGDGRPIRGARQSHGHLRVGVGALGRSSIAGSRDGGSGGVAGAVEARPRAQWGRGGQGDLGAVGFQVVCLRLLAGIKVALQRRGHSSTLCRNLLSAFDSFGLLRTTF